MATRRDQLQSYQFLLQRVVSALVYRKTDPANSPFRKAGGAVFAGVMLSILALAVTAVIQIFTGAWKDTKWYDGGKIIMEEETGAQYVVFPTTDHLKALEDQGYHYEQLLYPVANFASAALLAGTTEVVEVSRESLAGEGLESKVPSRGMMVGIPGLPDSLPTPEELLKPGWAVCSNPTEDEGATSVLYVGVTVGGDLVPNVTDPAQPGQALLLSDPGDDTIYLVWNGYKHKLVDPDMGLAILNTGDPLDVAPAVLKAIPSGADFAAPAIAKVGDTSSAVAGTTIGDVYRTTNTANTQFHVILDNGPARISEVQAELITRTHDTEILDGEVGAVPDANQNAFLPDRSDKKQLAQALPQQIPQLAPSWDPTAPVCVNYTSATDPTQIVINADDPGTKGVATQQVSNDKNTYADRIVIPPGGAMLVQTGQGAGARGLITSEGCLFLFTSPTGGEQDKMTMAVGGVPGIQAVGYHETKPVTIPSELEALIPPGPAFDAVAAANTTVLGVTDAGK